MNVVDWHRVDGAPTIMLRLDEEAARQLLELLPATHELHRVLSAVVADA